MKPRTPSNSSRPFPSETWLEFPLNQIQLLSPTERQEVWAAVTYLRSKKARMEESNFSANAYDRVYSAPRPEIFFKSLPEKVGCVLANLSASAWTHSGMSPEPELALVINSQGTIVGYTIGNDMSSRDIEGENLLYLPQAKIYHRSCAVGPCIVVGSTETVARTWTIRLQIYRGGGIIFEGQTTVNQIKRSFEELVTPYRSQTFTRGAVLLTGTGIVPGDNFTLQPDDRIRIEVNGIGVLENTVIMV